MQQGMHDRQYSAQKIMIQVMLVETDYHTVRRFKREVSISAYETPCKNKWIQHRHSMLSVTACHVGERAKPLVVNQSGLWGCCGT